MQVEVSAVFCVGINERLLSGKDVRPQAEAVESDTGFDFAQDYSPVERWMAP